MGNYTAVYDTQDGTEAGQDWVVGILAGIASFATLIGLALGVYALSRIAQGKKIFGK